MTLALLESPHSAVREGVATALVYFVSGRDMGILLYSGDVGGTDVAVDDSEFDLSEEVRMLSDTVQASARVRWLLAEKTDGAGGARVSLRRLVRALETETQPYVRAWLSHALVAVARAGPVETLDASTQDVAGSSWAWNVLARYVSHKNMGLEEGTGTELVCAATELLGWLVHSAPSQAVSVGAAPPAKRARGAGAGAGGGGSERSGRVALVLELLERSLDYNSDADLRLAAVRALAHCRLLYDSAGAGVETSAPTQERLWICALKALQDDDEEVRERANLAVAGAALYGAYGSDSREEAEGIYGKELVALTTTDRNLEWAALKAARAATMTASDSVGDAAMRLLGLLHVAVGEGAKVLSLATVDPEEMSRRIFEQDEANLYYEPLFEASCVAAGMAELVRDGVNDSTHATMVSAVLVAAAELAEQGLEVLCGVSAGGVQWLGDPTYNPEIFRFCHGALACAVPVLSALPAVVCAESLTAAGIQALASLRSKAHTHKDLGTCQRGTLLHPWIQDNLKTLQTVAIRLQVQEELRN
jgi:hypothetical protein